jgi:hypothetical protein
MVARHIHAVNSVAPGYLLTDLSASLDDPLLDASAQCNESVCSRVEKPFGVFDDAYDEPPFQHSCDDGRFWPQIANLKDESRSLDQRYDVPGDAGRERFGDAGMLASDLPDGLAVVRKRLVAANERRTATKRLGFAARDSGSVPASPVPSSPPGIPGDLR